MKNFQKKVKSYHHPNNYFYLRRTELVPAIEESSEGVTFTNWKVKIKQNHVENLRGKLCRVINDSFKLCNFQIHALKLYALKHA